MPSFPVVVSSLLIPAAAVLAGSVIPVEPVLRRAVCKSTYTSKIGDTCATMDQKYGLASGTIYGANGFLNCSDVWVGTQICVPDGPYACSETYYSQKGDTCDSIEKSYGLDTGEILGANKFLTCTDIWEHTPICIPAGDCSDIPCKSTYISVLGDTCASIEQKYHLATNAIKDANDFVTCDDIWKGTPLCIPDGGCTPQTHISVAGDTWYVLLWSLSERHPRLTESTL